MKPIARSRAFANNEVAVVAWNVDEPIPGCLGFELTRIFVDTGEERVLPAWVAFDGQRNPKWLPQTTSVWPVQKLFWRDLTPRKRRDRAERRPSDLSIKYRIRALAAAGGDVEPIADAMIPPKTYDGDELRLGYVGDAAETNDVLITAKHGSVSAAFTNGILAAQWLRHALEEQGETLSPDVLRKHMRTPSDPLREYLTGDVLDTLRELLLRGPGGDVYMALYELSDTELKDAIAAHKALVHLVLSNTGKERNGTAWDVTNSTFRPAVMKALGKSRMRNRMFNNNHIGHNKFAIACDAAGNAQAVMTGSTNWTPTGLCGQSNNAVVIESQALADQYLSYWNNLWDDTRAFDTPKPLSVATSNVQGDDLRRANATPLDPVMLDDGTTVTTWFSPNTERTSTDVKKLPPDLAYLFSRMRKAKDIILFAAFLPSRQGLHSIIEEAIQLGLKDKSLIVYGAVSDPQAMPNYVPPPKKTEGGSPRSKAKTPPPSVYDEANVHIVRASALTKDDVVGDFEAELLKAGNAIIHDKIVVVDPLSSDGFVAMGSHNLGYKASYENDENLLVLENNPTLVEAYAVHVIDLYEHYRYRAVRATQQPTRKQPPKRSAFDGFLSRDDHWLHDWVSTSKGDLAAYLSGS